MKKEEMDTEKRQLMEVLRKKGADPLAEDFIAAYRELAIRSLDRETENNINRILSDFVIDLERELRSTTANKDSNDSIRKKAEKFCVIYQGTDFAKRVRELVLRLSLPTPKPEPGWFQEMRNRIGKITSIFDPDIDWMIKKSDQIFREWQNESFWTHLSWMIINLLEGLLQKVQIDTEDLSRLGNLLNLEKVLKKSESLSPFFECHFFPSFVRIGEQYSYLRDRKASAKFSARCWRALEDRDYKAANDLIAEASKLSLLPQEIEDIKKAKEEAGRIERIVQEAEKSLRSLDMQMVHLNNQQELGCRLNMIVEQIKMVVPLLQDLPRRMREKYEKAMSRIAALLGEKNIPIFFGFKDKEDFSSIIETPFSYPNAEGNPQVENLLTLIKEQEDSKWQIDAVEGEMRKYRPELATLLMDMKKHLERENYQLSSSFESWMEARIAYFFTKGTEKELTSFLAELEYYRNKISPLQRLLSMDKMIRVIENLRQILKISQQIASFNEWTLYREFLSLDEALFIRYSDSSLLKELEKKRTKLATANLYIEKAEEAYSLGDLSECEALLGKISGIEDNKRLISLHDRLENRKMVKRMQDLIESNRFEEARKLLAAFAQKISVHFYDQLKDDLEKKQEDAHKLQEIRNCLLKNLSSNELIGLMSRIKKMLPEVDLEGGLSGGQLSPTSFEVRVKELWDMVVSRLVKTLHAEIDKLEVNRTELTSLSQIQTKMGQIETIQGHIQEAARTRSMELLLDQTHQKMAILKVREALTLRRYDQARSLCAQKLSRDKDMRERQYFERTIAFQEAVECYQTKGEYDQLLNILVEPWYGQVNFTLPDEEMWRLLLDLLNKGRLKEVPSSLVDQRNFRLIKLVDDCLHLEELSPFQSLLNEIKKFSPENEKQAAELLNPLLRTDEMPKNVIGLLFLWEGIPPHLKKLLMSEGPSLAPNLEQRLNEKIGENVHALKQVQQEVEIADDVSVLSEAVKRVEEVISFFDQIQSLHPEIYREKNLSREQEGAVRLNNRLRKAERVISDLSQIGESGKWIQDPEILKKLKEELEILPLKFKISGKMRQQVNDWINKASHIHRIMGDIIIYLQKGYFYQCLDLCNQLKECFDLPGAGEFIDRQVKSSFQDKLSLHLKCPGISLETFAHFEQMLGRIQENLVLTEKFIHIFHDLTTHYHLDYHVLESMTGELNYYSSGYDGGPKKILQRIQNEFFPPEIYELFKEKWPQVRQPLTNQAEYILRGLLQTDEFKVFQNAYKIIIKNEDRDNG